MDRTKLKKSLEQEVGHYLGIPYFINSPKNPHQRLSVQVGKGNWQQIKKYTQKTASLSPQQLYNFLKKHGIGIDCSGLVYHLSDFLHQQLQHQSIRSKLIGSQGKKGPRRLSARLLTSPPNAIPISSKQIQTGDLIRSKNGHHVLMVIAKTTKKLKVVDSSRRGRGVKISFLPLPLPTTFSPHRLQVFTSLRSTLRT